MAMSTRQIESMRDGESLTDDAPRGGGVLEAKRRSGRVRFYFRYTTSEGSRDRLPLGTFDRDGKRGLTLKEAQTRATHLRREYLGGVRDLRAAMEQRERQQVAERAAKLAAAELQRVKKQATLGVLCTAYVAQLKHKGRTSQREVERALHRHVRDAWPDLWAKPAADFSAEDAVVLLEGLIQAGKRREASKLRSYLRAGYGAAVASHTNPDAVPLLRQLKLRANPMRDVGAISGGSDRRDRTLSVPELQAYWARIVELPAPAGPLLRFHLLTGAQRAEQLARIQIHDWDSDANTFTLWDRKGRREQPRRHVVPLIPAAVEALISMADPRAGEFVFTVSNGMTGARYPSLAKRVGEVAAAMVKAGEAAAPFTPGALRRTVESRLAELGVPESVRAQIQSHGLGGVQARHYDRHDYAAEKRDALMRFYALVSDC